MCEKPTIYDETKRLEHASTAAGCPECEREHERLCDLVVEQATARVQAEQTITAMKAEIERLKADFNRAAEQLVKRQPVLRELRKQVEILKDVLANVAKDMMTRPGMEKMAVGIQEFLGSLEPGV